MSAILAIPLHKAQSLRFSTIERCAEHFKTTCESINECLDKGTILFTDKGKKWVFDEAIETRGKLRVFRSDDGEEVSVYGAKEFCEWSGYKCSDSILHGQQYITNRNNGKIYYLISEEDD